MRERSISAAWGYLLAVALSGAAVALRWLVDPWVGARLILVTLPAAVAATVWLGGLRPALLAAVAGYVACAYVFGGPSTGAALPAVSALFGLLAYAVSCSLIIGFAVAVRRAQARARRREAFLWVTLASIGDAVITTDPEGRITYLNGVAESLMGWRAEEAVGRPLDAVLQLINEETREIVESPAAQALRRGAIVGLAKHTVLVAKDGRERPIDDSAAPIRDEKGRIAGSVLVFRDITQRRRAELGLQRSERELAEFFENASVGLHWVGPDGTILRANRAQLALLGYREEEYVGHPVAQFHADQAAIEDVLARLARAETVRDHPARMRGKNGSIRDVLVTSNALFEDGAFIHSRCFIVDVTDHKRAEEARALLASIVSASDDAIVSKTLDGVILSWNAGAERLFGYTAAEAVGQSITLIIPPDLREEERSILRRLRAGERIDHFETMRLTKDGRHIDISLTVSPIRDDAGRIVGASKIARDITARKAAEEALREADRRKTEFLAMLAHELRNPLAPIRNSLEILKRAEDDRLVVRQSRETIERQVGHMVRLVDDLLDVSRITRDKLELRKVRVELASVLHQALEVCRPVAAREGQAIEVALPERPLYLDADPVRLAQVFGNLLNNACKYTERGGTIRVDAERQGGDVMVSVKDSGIGIPVEKLESIFEMFAQVDDAAERSRTGLGIGLTLVKRLVELHGGRVEAHSRGLGRGSEFVVRLPGPVEEAADRKPAAALAVGKSSAPLRVLVVDDNLDSAESLARLLKLEGHETRIAYDGLETVEIAEQFRPDVILLDIGLPQLSGLEACRRIRGEPWGRGMVMIALTGWGQDEDRERSEDAGFDGHLVKPVGHDTLTHLLGSLPSGSRAPRMQG